jgi:YbbR domain-containing protein
MKAQAQTAPKLKPSMFQSLFVENLGIKLVSLAVAVALAVFVRGEKTALSEFKMKVQYTLDDERILTSTPQGEVIVRLKGSETLLNNLAEDGLPILRVDLADQQSGQLCFKLRADQLPIGYHSLQIEELLPKCVPLTLEKRTEKEVSVVADITGTPSEGYSLGAVTVSPDKVTITGAESAVGQVMQVRTEPISLSGATADKKLSAPLQPFPEKANVWYKNGILPQAEVTIAITPQKIEKTVGGVKVVLNPPPVGDQYKQLSDALDVVVYGPKPVVDTIDPASLRIEINIEETLKMTAPKTIATLRVDTTQLTGLPEDVLPVSFRPNAEIKVYVQEPPKPAPAP